MENVALRLDLGFLSLMSDSPVKIFGNEIAREIHDMNCELVETALRLQKKIADKFAFEPTEERIGREVSRYGATNTAEWFAESFAEGMRSSSPRRMAAELMKELDELMRRFR